MNPQNLAQMIDHTCLKAEATEEEIFALCRQAKAYKFYAVCVNSLWVKFAKHFLKDTNVKVCSTVGFPLGAMHFVAKAYEAKKAVLDGADEIDMVLQVGGLKSENHDLVSQDIRAVVEASEGRPVKVTLETALLEEFEIAEAVEIAVRAGARFIKTSTGTTKTGATVEHVKMIRGIVGPNFGIKASGGIRNQEQALALVDAGASRLGTSASIAIIMGDLQPSA